MKFYEFKNSEFNYYALIGASSEEQAIDCYKDEIADIDNDNCPSELTKIEALDKYKIACKNEGENDDEINVNDFEQNTSGVNAFVFLIDNALI